MRQRIIALALMVAALGAFSPSASANVCTVVFGKYHKPSLHHQWGECHGMDCPGCMHECFPNPYNPFDTGHGSNCEGIKSLPNIWYGWLSWLDLHAEWRGFCIFSEREVLLNTVTHCVQRYDVDIHCTWWDPFRLVWAETPGAYLVGDEWSLGLLEDDIERHEIGYPVGPDPYDWSEYIEYIRYCVHDDPMLAPYVIADPWYVAWKAATAYWGDALTGGIPTGGERSLDAEFARKVFTHTLVAWQSPGFGHGQEMVDILTPNGIAPFTFDPHLQPTFLVWLQWAIWQELQVPVRTQQTTWSSVKVLYR